MGSAQCPKKRDPELIEHRETSIDVLGSQGLLCSTDRSAVMLHTTTVCSQYYAATYGLSSMNADRGGFGLSSDGTTFGCIFDGVSCGGKINVYAAQAFTSFVLKRLATDAIMRQCLLENTTETAERLFAEATSQENNPGRLDPKHEAECGAATGAFVVFSNHERQGVVICSGAAIGDAALIVVDRAQCTAMQLNSVSRVGHDVRDSGGQLDMCMGIHGVVSGFQTELHAANSIIILCTDGLTDNLTNLEKLLPWVIGCAAFDVEPPGSGVDHIPVDRIDGQKLLQESAGLEQQRKQQFNLNGQNGELPSGWLRETSSEQAAVRLGNFVEWISRRKKLSEIDFYDAMLRQNELMKRRALLQSDLDSVKAGKQDAVAQRHELEKELAEVVQALEVSHADIESKIANKPAHPGKTDDLALIVLRPLHDQAWL